MEKEELIKELTQQIWNLNRRIHIWNFIYGKNSSQLKVNEITKYLTNWISYEFQQCLETKILVDLRAIIDKSNDKVISIYKLFDQKELKELNKLYKDILIYVNNSIAHKNYEVRHSYTFKDIDNTMKEIQRLIDKANANIDMGTVWEVGHLFDEDLASFYLKVQKVNELLSDTT